MLGYGLACKVYDAYYDKDEEKNAKKRKEQKLFISWTMFIDSFLINNAAGVETLAKSIGHWPLLKEAIWIE